MKILGLEIKRVGNERELRHGTNESHEITYYGGDLGLSFAELLGQSTAMNISAVYRATEIISDSIAMLPIDVKIKSGDFKNHITNHSLYKVFDNKNNLISKYNLMKLLIQSVILKGNGFAYIERNGDGSVKNVIYVESGDVSIKYDKYKNNLYYLVPLITSKKIEPCNMIHLKKNSYDGINGISVISFANRSIRNANSTENSALNFFKSGCNLSGVLTVDGQLNPQQRIDIANNWNKAYNANGSGLAVLQGNMHYQPIQLSANDSQLLESRTFNVSDIARFFGISPVLLGDLSNMSYNTIEAIQQDFLLHTLQPYIVMVEEEFTKKLLKPSEENLMIDLDETYLLRTDKSATSNYYTSLVNNGIISRNEARKELGYEEIEGGDKLIIPFTNIEDNTLKNNKDDEGDKE